MKSPAAGAAGASAAASAERSTTPPRRSSMAWLTSLVLHALLFVALGLSLQLGVSRGVPGGPERELAGEIVLKHHAEQGEYYESQGDAQSTNHNSAADSASADAVLGAAPAVQPSATLPQGDLGTPTGGGTASGGGLNSLAGGPSQPRVGGGGTKTSFLGIESQGNSFAFVIDRSTSMSHSGRLAAAKAELVAALRQLTPKNQFQIIFFNNDLHSFSPYGNRAFLADEATLRLAERFVGGVTADGPTDGFHRALRTAMNYHPDVVYFLTDAEDIALTDAELTTLQRQSYGTAVHAVLFGEGAEVRVPWMLKLSSQNGGQYRYIDTRQFGRGR